MQIFTVNTLKKHYNILSVNLEYDYASIFSLIQLKLRNEYEPRWFKISDFIFCNEIIIDGFSIFIGINWVKNNVILSIFLTLQKEIARCWKISQGYRRLIEQVLEYKMISIFKILIVLMKIRLVVTKCHRIGSIA